MPHDLERTFRISKLHSGDVREIVVLLFWIVSQPPYDLEKSLARGIYRRLAPYDLDATDCLTKARLERRGGRVGRSSFARDVMRRGGRRRQTVPIAGVRDRRARGHKPERV